MRCLLVLLAACGSDPPANDAGARADATLTDAGPIARTDAGALPDAARPPPCEDPSRATFTDGVWTPRRDASGVVLLEEWSCLPLMTWIDAGGTRLDALAAEVEAAIPGYSDRGNEDWNGVTDDWVGMAWDTRAGLERGFIGPGGGHDGSANNGVYQLDVSKLEWSVLRLPDDPSNWPAEYSANFTHYPPAEAVYASMPSAPPEGVYWDELYDPGNPAASTRAPTSRHTYGSLVFAPDRNELMMGCRRFWRFDLATHAWLAPRFHFDHPADYEPMYYTGENMDGFWDEAEGRYYVSATQNYNSSAPFSFAIDDEEWRWEDTAVFGGGYPTAYKASARDGRDWILVFYGGGEELRYAGLPSVVRRVDMNTRTATDLPVVLGSSFAMADFEGAGEYWDGQTVAYVPSANLYVVNVVTTAGMEWATIDSAGVLERFAIGGSYLGESASNANRSIETKTIYLPRLGVFLWVDRASSNVRLIRFE